MTDENTPEATKKKPGRPPLRDNPVTDDREDMRAGQREDDPRARAERRAAEIRKHLKGDTSDGADRFWIDPSIIPDGWSYEWKRKTIWGKEDPAHEVELARQGWEVVPATRHPQMMPKGNWQTIERDGMILMERPAEITAEVKRLEIKKARAQVQQKQAQLGEAPAGQFERTNKGDPLAKIKKNYEPIVIPDE